MRLLRRYQPPPTPPLQPRISASRTRVPVTETTIDPKQPRRFEKKANTPKKRAAGAHQPHRYLSWLNRHPERSRGTPMR